MVSKKLFSLAIAIFIVTIMIASVININDSNSEDSYKYNNYKFVKTNKGWLTYINNQPITLTYSPKELENININFNLNGFNSKEKIYLSYNPDDNLLQSITEFSTYIKFPRTVLACYEDNEKCSELPIKTCKDASSSIGIIIFKKSSITKVNLENNCLTFQGTNEELLKYIDKLILTNLGI